MTPPQNNYAEEEHERMQFFIYDTALMLEKHFLYRGWSVYIARDDEGDVQLLAFIRIVLNGISCCFWLSTADERVISYIWSHFLFFISLSLGLITGDGDEALTRRRKES